jgi:hypothetical protein
MITTIFRATATFAFLMPIRLAIFILQGLEGGDFFVRESRTVAVGRAIPCESLQSNRPNNCQRFPSKRIICILRITE